MCVRHFELGHGIGHDETNGCVLTNAEEGAEALHLFLEGYLGIHGRGFLAEATNLELKHLVLGDGTYLVSALCHAIESVGTGEVASRHFQIALCRGEVEEIGAGAGRDEFDGLGIAFLCLGVAQGFDTLVPL